MFSTQLRKYLVRRGSILPALAFLSPGSLVSASFETASTSFSDAVQALRILPAQVHLHGKNASQRILVMGTLADGREKDITARSILTVESNIADLDSAGRIRALESGETQLRAQVSGRIARIPVRITDANRERPFRFATDVEAVLTKGGCNQSECHGSIKGRGGFKLSLNGIAPREDHRWIVEGGGYQVLSAKAKSPLVPRVNLNEPAKSLLLTKSTMSIPHGGGKRLEVDSGDYRVLWKWIQKGASLSDRPEATRFERLEVFPDEPVLEPGDMQQLLVVGHLSDGASQDLTQKVAYQTLESSVASISSEGLLTGKSPGESAILIRAPGLMASIQVGVVAHAAADYPEMVARNPIDEHIFRKLRKLRIAPSELSSDSEFLRRVCLDLTGTLPPVERVQAFLKDRNPEKRSRLIEELLTSPEYVEYWTFRFSDFLRVSVNSSSNGRMYQRWVRDSIAANKPYDELARDRIAAQGYDGPSRHFHDIGGNALPAAQIMMAEQVRVFLGRRLDCAECHNHPHEAWSQDQFWGMAAFFARSAKSIRPCPWRSTR